jgi:hypothetical protein
VGWRRCNAGDQSRGGFSLALADLGYPGLILDRIWPGRKLAACVIHLGGLRGSAAAVAARAAAGSGLRGGARGERARAQFRARDWAKKGVCACVVPEWCEIGLVWGCVVPQACCHGGAPACDTPISAVT